MMRAYAVLLAFSVLISLGLLTVILGQYNEIHMIKEKHRNLDATAKDYYDKLQSDSALKKSLEELVNQGLKTLKELDETMPTVGQKNADHDRCQEEMKRKKEELDAMLKIRNQTADESNTETELLKEEIVNSKAILAKLSPICEFVGNNTEAMKLCVKTS